MSEGVLFLSVTFFLLGALVASFVGVIVARLYTGQSFLRGRSQCDACTKPLSAFSLVPVLSFFAARGRATCCGARIALASPLTEGILGGIFVLAYQHVGLTLGLPFLLIAFTLMLALVLYDLAHQILPLPLLALFLSVSAVTGYFLAPSLAAYTESVYVALALALAIASLHFFSRGRAMGFADAPFVFGCALLVGPAAVAGLLFSFWIGAVIGLVILARRPRGTRMGVEVPFAPFLAAGFILAYFTQWNPFVYVAFAALTRLVG